MRDILINAKYVYLEDIITRQAGLGGIDLFGISPSIATQPWKKEYHQARKDYVNILYVCPFRSLRPSNLYLLDSKAT
jgi:hypothetical protein